MKELSFRISGLLILESEDFYIVIPKIIYYCWFGGGGKKSEIKEYIDEWKMILSDYQIIEINEKNFDVNKYKYTKEAYKHKKFAFVSDVARIEFLFKTGGFYFDTDIKLLHSLNKFRCYTAVFGFESSSRVMTAFMGVMPHNDIFRQWLDEYKQRDFVTSDGMDVTTNVEGLTCLLQKKCNLRLNGETQLKNDGIIVYASSFFHRRIMKLASLEKLKILL